MSLLDIYENLAYAFASLPMALPLPLIFFFLPHKAFPWELILGIIVPHSPTSSVLVIISFHNNFVIFHNITSCVL